ncbi:glutaredoxin 3 [Irregularibacter muris]|uniref:Glutaredoxin n=1 Tax=Irregularibacter muris TaxID=1796619 RepID=A0AAE3L0L1_9FIRM|nr:glutaredoxin 3 [Irregularibacter muris]MCR1900122.1 glutaredoxin 3 [Irregularibacter muris]
MTKVEIYTWTFCPFCIRAKELFERKNTPYIEHIIDGDDKKKKELYEKTNQDTVPFIFINDQFIGGYSDLQALEDEGKLDSMLG